MRHWKRLNKDQIFRLVEADFRTHFVYRWIMNKYYVSQEIGCDSRWTADSFHFILPDRVKSLSLTLHKSDLVHNISINHVQCLMLIGSGTSFAYV